MEVALSDATILHIQAGSIGAEWLPKEASAIVLATNKNLEAGSNTEIFTAAGPELESHCRGLQVIRSKKKWAKCHTGEAIVTPGFNLHAANIVHTVVPEKGRAEAYKFLGRCFSNCLAVARAHGVENIAFPPLGAPEFPVEHVAWIALSEFKLHHDGFKNINVVVDNKDLATWKKIVAEALDRKNEPPPPAAVAIAGELVIIYLEAVIRWCVPEKFLSINTSEFLHKEAFRLFCEREFNKFGIPVLTKPSVHPEGYSKQALRNLIDAKGVLLFEPDSSTEAQDLLSNQAREYRALLKKDRSIGIKDKKVRPPKVQLYLEMKMNQMKEKMRTLESNVGELNTKMETLEVEVARLKGKDVVLCRKMLGRSQAKARAHLVANRIPAPSAWNDVVADPNCVQALETAGLSQKALDSTKLGPFTLQEAGNEEAHHIYEPPEVYSTMIEKNYTGDTRDALLELHQYCFEV